MSPTPTDATSRLAQAQWSRRRFLGGGAALGGGLLLGPSLLAGCGGDSETSSSDGGGDQNSGGKLLRISNWPLYMAEGFNAKFEKETGYTVDYKENFQDNETWFAANRDALAAGQDIGADLVIPTNSMTTRLISLGWLTKLDHAKIPNMKNVRPDLIEGVWDPGAVYSMPYFTGFAGLAYNKAETGREITSVDDLWDPKFKGRVSMLSDMQDGLGMIMLAQGVDLADVTVEDVQQASDLVAEKNQDGQIRRFTGNDYQDDLTNGNVVIAQVYSGDVAQLQADNPDIEFVVPEGGGTMFIDTMVAPITTKNLDGAEAWMNFVYDKDNYAMLTDYVQYIPVLSDMDDALAKVNPELVDNPLVNPSQEVLDRVQAWPPLKEEDEAAMVKTYAKVTGG
ncbi:MAG: spermidine/putrescine ABC transporter substrate-binding protein [Candidatus Microthrix sp.]|jgi:spermidine/putrescine transport system substrate-binding protein|uniref:Spermidine/putrescine ABC transporter substrate-binding protein n=1 Tax=Candidatus Neomicrothrix subdominans TaxID=2954438 RepID=A0A936NDY3_9ACTN|nr:spermidine/putrescine ABC transporter substrate-binding protein [Candidatus Microthrix sp.]MBK9298210.1 spermidine/putrescine ABC transporter substrate-binding protein [Candidatus Microthrix subdominans]MBK6309720.1 spermidine/putrescine ABC transporter substrate-binding protein [Candidatus Microthrix sp.]MBK6438967.1 spermidine/putrescine ABC transporter substrate-binding protein [Candidatus Microthrix sp.]MBK7165263.1 spermidine/putrescine ABC transporter substrate-binding protein [Candida